MGDLGFFINNKSFKNGSSAEDFINNNQAKLEWSIEIFEGLSYIHSIGIFHRDIKPK